MKIIKNCKNYKNCKNCKNYIKNPIQIFIIQT